nr:MAG: hypothetical protein [Bacteriophage sp.]
MIFLIISTIVSPFLFTTTSNPGALHLTSLPTIKSAEPLIIDWRVATFKYKSHRYNGYLLSSPHIT